MTFRNEIPLENDELILQSSSCDNGTVLLVVKLRQSGTYLFAAGQPAGFGRKGFLKGHYSWTYITGDAGDQIEAKICFAPFTNWKGLYKYYFARFRSEEEIPRYRNWGIWLFFLAILLVSLLFAVIAVFR